MRKKQDLLRQRNGRRRLFLEALEGRRLLVATDLAAISGLVFDDFSGNGYDPGEEVAGASLSLYRDNGDGIFQSTSDTLLQTAVTATDGRYTFSRITSGNYFVLQDAQQVGGNNLQRIVSPLTSVGTTSVEGRIVRVIDDFDTTQQEVTDDTNDGIPVTSSVLAVEAIGGARDLYVNKTSENGAVNLSVDNPLLPNLLIFDSIATGNGERRVTWDGPDNDATVVTDDGLGNVDMTSQGDALGLQLQIGADLPGGNAVVRLYSDDGNSGTATRFSTATLAIPQTGGTVPFFAEFLPYTSFTASSGGGADLTDIGAIELEITGAANVNGSAELVGTVGQTVFTQDFANFSSADLRLTKTIDNATPNIGQNVTFTITLNNDGPDTATNVEVRDQLPVGVSFVSSTSTQGGYNQTTGIWSVGSVSSAASVSLTIVGRIESAGNHSNVAQVSASDQFDPNSTPNNNNPAENDQDSVSFVTESIDLSLVKTADPTTVIIGNNVSFLVTLSNAGPSTATGVQVQDQLPDGVSFVSSTPSQGSYNSNTGIWTVGSVAASGTATLSLVGRVETAGDKTNIAQVFAADQPDIDSTPGNNNPNEDDQDSATIKAPLIDLSLTKTVDNSTPDVGDSIVFTIQVANTGPDDATGVQVLDVLPSELRYDSSSTQTGSYNQSNGIWNIGSIPASQTATLTINVTPVSSQLVTNTAEVVAADQPDIDSTPGNNDPNEDDQDSVTVGPQQIDLALSKTVDNNRPNVGETIEFQVTVSNAGPSEATGVIVTDVLPTGLENVGSDTSVGSYSSASGQWNIGSIAAGGEQTLTIQALVRGSDAMTNTAEVTAATPIDINSTPGNNDPSENDQDSVLVTPQIADLSLTKSADNEATNVNQDVTFHLVLQNAGPDNATGVTVTDLLPDGITFVSSSPSQASYDADSGEWSVGTLASNSQTELYIVGRVQSSSAVTNTAQVSASDQFDPDSTPNNNVESEDDQDSVVITPPVADLSLSKTVDVPRPIIGQSIQYTVTVNNSGPDDATGVVVADELPEGVTFVSSQSNTGRFDASQGQWNIGNLPADASAELLITVQVNATTPTTNFAEVLKSDQYDPNSTPGNGPSNEDDEDSATFTPAVADLSLSKTVDNATPNVGDNVSFTIVVSNAGPDPATNVTVLDQLPQGLQIADAVPDAGTYDPKSGIWNIGNLGVNESINLKLVATSTAPGPVTNTAQVQTSDQIDPNSTPGNNKPDEDDQDSATVEGQLIDLELSKIVDDAHPNVGDEIKFTIQVDNQGPSNATGVSVKDLIPDGLSFQSSNATRGGYNAADGIWDLGSLAANDSASLDLFAIVDEILSVENIAEVVKADQPDADSTPNNGISTEDDQDSVTVVTQVADLSLTKLASNARPNVNEEVTFTINLNNAGPDPATNVRILDQLPDGLTYVSSVPSTGSYNDETGIWTIDSLANQSNASLQIVANVDRIGKTTNTAEVVAVDQADPNSTPNNNIPSEDDQDSTTIDPPVIDLSLAKAADPLRPRVNGVLNYVVLIRNDGPDRATGIVVEDKLPSGVTFVSATPSVGEFDSGTGHWKISSLAADAQATLLLQTTVNEPGEPENRAQVLAADQFDSDSTPGNDDGIDGNGNDEDDQASVKVVTASADLSLRKTIDNDQPGVGSNVTFTIEVANSGPDNAGDVVVKDHLPPAMTYVSSTATTGTYDPETQHWDIPTMVVGKIEKLEIVARVNLYGERTNTAEIIESNQYDPDSTPGNNVESEDDQDSVDFTPELIDLALAKLVDNPTPNVGETVRFSIVMDNAGPSTATEVQVTDKLPEGLTAINTESTQGVYDPASGIWYVGTVNVGERPRLDIDVRVESPEPKTNVAEVTAARQPDVDSTPGNGDPSEDDYGQAIITPQIADLELTSSVNISSANQDDEILFTVVVSNKGPSHATNVAIRNLLPDGLQVLQESVTIGTYNPESGVWLVPIVENGSAQALQIVGFMNSKLPITNEAEIIASDQYDPDSVPNNQNRDEDDFTEVTVSPNLIDISVSATADKQRPRLGELVEMTFRVRNDGPDEATGVAASIAIPEGLQVVSSRPSRGAYRDGVWLIGNVATSDTDGVLLTITARAESRGTKPVTFEITAHQQADINSDPNNHVESEDDQTTLIIIVPRYSKRMFLAS